MKSARPEVSTIGTLPHGQRQHLEMFYEPGKGYWRKSAYGVWIKSDKDSAKVVLSNYGFHTRPGSDGGRSEVDKKIVAIQNEASIDAAGEFAGHGTGPHMIAGRKVLATQSHERLEGTPGSHHLISAFLEGLFGKYKVYMDIHLKECRRALGEGRQRNGPVFIVIGKPGIGKTCFLERVIVPLLGNRSANCYRYLTKKTDFNDDLLPATVWRIDDDALDNTPRACRALAGALNKVATTTLERIEQKGKAAFSMAIYRRLFIFLNEEHMDCLAGLDDTLLSKVFLIPAHAFKIPKGLPKLPDIANEEEVDAFVNRINKELPHYAYSLDHYEVPRKYRSDRFGIKVVQDPDLMDRLRTPCSRMGQPGQWHWAKISFMESSTKQRLP